MERGPERRTRGDEAVADGVWSGRPHDGRLRAVLLLAGSVRRSPLADAVGQVA